MRRLVVFFAVGVLCACGEAAPIASQPSPTPSSGGCTSVGYSSLSWTLPQPASNPAPPVLSATVFGDTFTLTFFQGTPHFQLIPQPDAHFTQDPSGNAVNLAGTGGVRIVVIGFRGVRPSYTGLKTFTSTGPLLLQVAMLGDFEGSVIWGAGLSAPGCANVTSNGSTLTFHFIKAP